MVPKKYLTVNEVAKIFGVTPLTVRNWDKKGALVAHRNPVNNYRVYKIEDVEFLMKGIETNRADLRSTVKKIPPNEPRKLKIEVL
ncbi:MAG: MerR family DNA-binding transcriptional regulator [Candidatus Yanofskybacteria bacterium]|nr:MerR family DNA-binding transcriptional regulator [Candidatus Yanofskybacteria bacterium]